MSTCCSWFSGGRWPGCGPLTLGTAPAAAAASGARPASVEPAAAAMSPRYVSGVAKSRLLAPHPLRAPARASAHRRQPLWLQWWWPLWVLSQEWRGGPCCPSMQWCQLQVTPCRPHPLPQHQRQQTRQEQQHQPC